MKPTHLLLASCALALALPCAAQSRLELNSAPGDYIGGGRSYLYTDENATFRYSRNFDNGISAAITSNDGREWWYLDLAAPGDSQIKPGTYDGAMRFPFQPADRPGLNFSGTGRGCNTLTGRFDVFEVSYNSEGVVETLNASFVQNCDASTGALRGTISYKLTPPVGITTTGLQVRGYKCVNNTTGQSLTRATPMTLIDCRKEGLHVNPGDDISIGLNGKAK